MDKYAMKIPGHLVFDATPAPPREAMYYRHESGELIFESKTGEITVLPATGEWAEAHRFLCDYLTQYSKPPRSSPER
jgi:hypothetical protein